MPLPPHTLAELPRDMARLGFVVSQIREIEEARQKRLEQQPETGLNRQRQRIERALSLEEASASRERRQRRH
jgi:hypothetical protein